MKRVLSILTFSLLFSFTAHTIFAAQYKVGDKGPGGGWIFWAKINPSDGWQYLEVASEDQGLAEWGCYGKSIPEAMGRDFFEGKKNTQSILTACPGTNAAKLASEYRGGGKSDWYLPSTGELERIVIGLVKTGKIKVSEAYYWTSTQESEYSDGKFKSFIMHLGYYHMVTGNKYSKAKVLAVRAF